MHSDYLTDLVKMDHYDKMENKCVFSCFLQWETRPKESAAGPSADAQEALLPHRPRD